MFHSKIEIYFRKTRWQRFFLLSALLPALAALSSCGSSSTTATPTITLTSDSTSGAVNVNGTVQFTATITNLSSTLANFEVSLTGGTPVIGGNATVGFITSGGKYTAPPTIPLVNNVQSNSVVITAAAQAQTSLTATYTLTLLPPATISGISPQGATVAAGMTQPFTATFSSGTANGVNWFINNSPSCSATSALMGTTTSGSATVALTTGTASATIVGMQISGGGIPAGDSIASVTPTTITLVSPATASNTETITLLGYANGLVPGNGTNTYPYGKMTLQGNYTAPVIPPAGGTIALTAVSQADPAQTKCVMLTLTYGNASLSGPYAFSTNGRVISTSAFFARAGSFTAGNGAVSGGIETYNEVGQGIATQHPSFLGTYNIGPDGRGTMEFCEQNTAASSCTPTAVTAYFQVVIISAQQVQIMEFSPPGSSVAQRTGSGEMILQDASIITAGNPALTGAYSFDFSGISTGTTPLSMVGEFSADGRGNIGPPFNNSIPGVMDINNGGNLSQAQISSTSKYSFYGNGQGTAAVATNDPTFPNLAFTIYVVSASRAIFIESDGAAVMVGDAFLQQTSTCSTWGTNMLNGTTILQTSGRSSAGSVTDLISFTANGAQVASAGSNDENNAGTVSSGTSLGGTYYIDSTAGSCGRGTLSLGSPTSHTYVFYMISPSFAVVQETTSGVVGHGVLRQPQTGSVTLGTLNSFALNLAGSNAAGASAGREDVLGQMNVGSAGSLVANQAGSFGSLDINNPDGLGTTQTIALTSGTVAAAGSRYTMALTSTGTTRHYVLYLLSPTNLFVMSTDSTGVAQGSLYQQF